MLGKQFGYQIRDCLRKDPVALTGEMHAVDAVEFCGAFRIEEGTSLPFGNIPENRGELHGFFPAAASHRGTVRAI